MYVLNIWLLGGRHCLLGISVKYTHMTNWLFQWLKCDYKSVQQLTLTLWEYKHICWLLVAIGCFFSMGNFLIKLKLHALCKKNFLWKDAIGKKAGQLPSLAWCEKNKNVSFAVCARNSLATTTLNGFGKKRKKMKNNSAHQPTYERF